jgi:hypothetical protein
MLGAGADSPLDTDGGGEVRAAERARSAARGAAPDDFPGLACETKPASAATIARLATASPRRSRVRRANPASRASARRAGCPVEPWSMFAMVGVEP